MKNFVKEYYKNITNLTNSIEISIENQKKRSFHMGICLAAELIKKQSSEGKKLIFIGNGASATISSHQAIDYWKNAKIRATTFNDAALLTALSNDIGYKYVFEKPIEMFADSGDILIAISSSGKSECHIY